jgi:hypothetical protein
VSEVLLGVEEDGGVTTVVGGCMGGEASGLGRSSASVF